MNNNECASSSSKKKNLTTKRNIKENTEMDTEQNKVLKIF